MDDVEIMQLIIFAGCALMWILLIIASAPHMKRMEILKAYRELPDLREWHKEVLEAEQEARILREMEKAI